ncbi:ultraviolet N-glycosylase/AP lyase [bacterium BMS3Abin05]|nr:ultraviolet N-glycosylase/AP lyase [bacterium BMS3Abin05]GBE26901.1 ultraviolet N-glycosylase/AP lyase [bacterium BMS3Bbin03]HDK35955.1 endonuclease III [Bacteroidota bacterium]
MKDRRLLFAELSKRLKDYFGEPERPDGLNPLDVLIETILSQNTNDRNRDIAFKQLKQHFPTWEETEKAPAESVEEAIRPAGLARQKAPRIQHIIKWIENEYGTLDIGFICDWDIDEVIQTFTQLKGIGIKTISVVLMFACGKNVFPVDTHIHRISKRLGLISEKTSAEKAHSILGDWVPPEEAYSVHINLLRLGRTICLARKPKCDKCPVWDLCDYGRQHKDQGNPR